MQPTHHTWFLTVTRSSRVMIAAPASIYFIDLSVFEMQFAKKDSLRGHRNA